MLRGLVRRGRSEGKKKKPADKCQRAENNPGDDRLSRGEHYHGPRLLNGRVRDGNGCGQPGVVAGTYGGRRERVASASSREGPSGGSMRRSVRLLVPVG